jgi:hypothetical protein
MEIISADFSCVRLSPATEHGAGPLAALASIAGVP